MSSGQRSDPTGSSQQNLAMPETVLLALALAIIPIFLAIYPPVFIVLLFLLVPLVRSDINLPLWCCFLFVYYDWVNLALINAGLDIDFEFFQGTLLFLIMLLLAKMRGLSKWPFFLFTFYLIFAVFVGLSKDASLSKALVIIKNLLIFPTFIYAIIQGRPTWTIYHTIAIGAFASLNLIFHQMQAIVGFEQYFLSLGMDLFYQQRHISGLGQLPIGFLSIDAVTGKEIQRAVGIFLSPDKVAYLVGLMILIAFAAINLRWKLDFFTNSVIIIIGLLILFIFHVKAVVLQFAVFAASFVLMRYFGVRNFTGRLVLLGFLISGAVLLVLLFVPRSILSSTGAVQHLWGLVNPILNTRLGSFDFFFGHGLGTGGTLGGVQTVNLTLSKHDTGGESFIGTAFYQMGVIGLLTWTIVLAYIDRKAHRLVATANLPGLRYSLLSSLLLSVPVASAFSEPVLSLFQSAAFATAGLFFLTGNPQAEEGAASPESRLQRSASTLSLRKVP